MSGQNLWSFWKGSLFRAVKVHWKRSPGLGPPRYCSEPAMAVTPASSTLRVSWWTRNVCRHVCPSSRGRTRWYYYCVTTHCIGLWLFPAEDVMTGQLCRACNIKPRKPLERLTMCACNVLRGAGGTSNWGDRVVTISMTNQPVKSNKAFILCIAGSPMSSRKDIQTSHQRLQSPQRRTKSLKTEREEKTRKMARVKIINLPQQTKCIRSDHRLRNAVIFSLPNTC